MYLKYRSKHTAAAGPTGRPFACRLGLSGLPLFVLNGLGYLALVAALYLPVAPLARYRNAVRWVLVGYVALTIALWAFVGARNAMGYADKLVEVALISLLLIERVAAPAARQPSARWRTSPRAPPRGPRSE